MPIVRPKGRFVRMLPGRVRIEVFGLKNNPLTAMLILRRLGRSEGIARLSPCIATGRVLLVYDRTRITFERIFQTIRSIEEQMEQTRAPAKEVAVTIEPVIQKNMPTVPKTAAKDSATGAKRPLPGQIPPGPALPIAGLAGVGVKQIVTGGASALARHPVAFCLAGFVSIATGYPFFTRRLQQLSTGGKHGFDLLFAGTLILSLVRENLVMLSGLSLLQYLNWRRNQNALHPETRETVSRSCPTIRQYSERAEKLGFILAAAAWAFTRNPLTGLAVLLAANPRSVTLSAEYAWNHAEVVSRERKYLLPDGGSLPQLARTRILLFEDTSLIFEVEQPADIRCVSHRKEAEKIWCLAAPLLKKSNHPWQETVLKKAKATGRTLRTCFHVEKEEQGMKGVLNGWEVLIGDKGFMQQNGVDSSEYEIEAKRLKKAGYWVQYVAKRERKRDACLGLLAAKPGNMAPDIVRLVKRAKRNQWEVAVLHNSLHVDDEMLARHGISPVWMTGSGDRLAKRMAAIRQQGKSVLFITENPVEQSDEPVRSSNIPSVPRSRIDAIFRTAEYAKRIDRMIKEHIAVNRLWNVIGCSLAISSGLSAYAVNTIADAMLLIFLARAKRIGESCITGEPAPDGSGVLPRMRAAATA